MPHPHPDSQPHLHQSLPDPLRNRHAPVRPILTTHAQRDIPDGTSRPRRRSPPLPAQLALPKVDNVLDGRRHGVAGARVPHDVVLDDGGEARVRVADVGGGRGPVVGADGVEVEGVRGQVLAEEVAEGGRGRGQGVRVREDVDCWLVGL